MLSDPVAVKGPQGLSGVVIWPGLTFNVWGSKLVRNEALEEALDWAQVRVTGTAEALATHLELVIARLREGNLIKSRSYLDDVTTYVRRHWGSPWRRAGVRVEGLRVSRCYGFPEEKGDG
jgi:hypothetical protein